MPLAIAPRVYNMLLRPLSDVRRRRERPHLRRSVAMVGEMREYGMHPLSSEMLAALQGPLAAAIRWSGAIARLLRPYNIALEGKTSGSAATDALTLADLAVQELLVAALRDCGDVFRHCRIEAEESTGDLAAFSTSGALTIALDPIDGTQRYRDHTGEGYGVLLHLRDATDVCYTLAFFPALGPDGTWVQADATTGRCGPDRPQQAAGAVLAALPSITPPRQARSTNIYVSGFQHHERARADAVTQAGLRGVPAAEMPSSIFPLLATGEFTGVLIHSPNLYDFPIALHIVRLLGGDAVWVHDGAPVHFRDTWMDERAKMRRLPGIVACAVDHATLHTLVNLARDWNPHRYAD
jgi:3'(2'), 5'-bisphosphate nucleotidase